MIIKVGKAAKIIMCLMLVAIVIMVCSRISTAVVMMTASEKTVIIIDAGHGGPDGGAEGADGTMEKDLNLDIALRLRDLLTLAGYEVIMTRTEDESTAHGEGFNKSQDIKNRLETANSYPNAIFVSIHLNKFGQSQYWGAQVFYSSNNPDSSLLAQCVQISICNLLQPENKRQIKLGDDNSYILKKAKNPAVIVECGFLSNASELEKLKSMEYRAKLAYCIFLGISDFEKERT